MRPDAVRRAVALRAGGGMYNGQDVHVSVSGAIELGPVDAGVVERLNDRLDVRAYAPRGARGKPAPPHRNLRLV